MKKLGLPPHRQRTDMPRCLRWPGQDQAEIGHHDWVDTSARTRRPRSIPACIEPLTQQHNEEGHRAGAPLSLRAILVLW